MGKDILCIVKGVTIGATIMTVLMMILSLGLEGKLPRFGSSAASLRRSMCAPYQQVFEETLTSLLLERRVLPFLDAGLARQLDAANKAHLADLYVASVEHNPQLTCVVAFLRHKDLAMAPHEMTQVLAYLYVTMRMHRTRIEADL